MSEDIFHLGIKALIANPHGNLLLLLKNQANLSLYLETYWDLPGSRVHKGFSHVETLRREVSEETGITALDNIRHVGMALSTLRIPVDDQTTAGLILSLYSCTTPAPARVFLSDEHIDYRWVSPREAADLLRASHHDDLCELVANAQPLAN